MDCTEVHVVGLKNEHPRPFLRYSGSSLNSSATLKKSALISDFMELATFGAGCFWCVEAVFQNLKGVEKVVSGYAGGRIKNPTYKEVCSGLTGHAEVIQITFDPAIISYEELLEILFKTHDPTTLNRQGADAGTQYRSVIYYHNAEQHRLAEEWKKKLNDHQAFPNPVVTEITAMPEFFPAEDYHQNYFNLHGHEPYCQFVARPKVDKVKALFGEKLRAGV
jgi:peptide-methionine (S)-S-oxide reductase